jgi:hypothetical protein
LVAELVSATSLKLTYLLGIALYGEVVAFKAENYNISVIKERIRSYPSIA